MANYTFPLYVTRSGRVKSSQNYPNYYNDSTNLLAVKRGDVVNFAVYFVDEGTSNAKFLLETDSTVTVGIKKNGEFDGDYIVEGNTSANPATSADPYVIEVDFGGVSLAALLNHDDGDSTNDIALIDLMFELTWLEVANKPNSSIQPILIRVYNDVNKGSEGTPDALPAPDDDWLAHGHAQSLTDGQKIQALNNLGLPSKNNYTATAAPIASDDSSEGYSVGSKWYDTVAKEAYVLVDSTAGAAVWANSTLTPDELGSAAFEDVEDLPVSAAQAAALALKADKNILPENSIEETDSIVDYPQGRSYLPIADAAVAGWDTFTSDLLIVTDYSEAGGDLFDTGEQRVYRGDGVGLLGVRYYGEIGWSDWEVPATTEQLALKQDLLGAALEVPNAAARKNAATYSTLDPVVVPYLGMFVRQTDLPNRVFQLQTLDVTLDSSWFGFAGLDADGNLLVTGIVPNSFTTAEALEDVPGEGELAFRENSLGLFDIVKGNGDDVAADLPNVSGNNPNFVTADNPPLIRSAENWKVWGELILEEGAYLDFEEGASLQLI